MLLTPHEQMMAELREVQARVEVVKADLEMKEEGDNDLPSHEYLDANILREATQAQAALSRVLAMIGERGFRPYAD